MGKNVFRKSTGRLRNASSGVYIAVVGFFLFIALTVLPVRASTAYSVSGSRLYTFDLETPDCDVTRTVQLPKLGHVWALAESPSGFLYLVEGGPADKKLWALDPATGEAVLVGDLGLSASVDDLACDAEGRLWMIADGSLYSVNPRLGRASWVSPTLLVALAVHGRHLYGLHRSAGGYRVVTVDGETGSTRALSTVYDLQGVSYDMTLDAAGELWILSVAAIPPITPPTAQRTLLRMDSPSSAPKIRCDLTSPEQSFHALATGTFLFADGFESGNALAWSGSSTVSAVGE